MLDRKFRKCGLEFFNYKRTPWYQTIRNDTRGFKYNLIFGAVFVCAIVPFVLLVSSFTAGTLNLPLFVGFSVLLFASILTEYVLLIKFKKIRFLSTFVLFQFGFNFIASLFLPIGNDIVLVLVLVFPSLALLLQGTLKGSVYVLLGIFLAVCVYSLQSFGFNPSWFVSSSVVRISAICFLGVLLSILAIYTERRHEQLIGRLTDLLVFNQSTGLPGREVLTYSLAAEKSYIFAIIKIENFSDLVALFGYEFSDTISQFASSKLKKYESCYGYTTFHLKYNEYGILINEETTPSSSDAIQFLGGIIKSLELESLPWESDRIRLVYRVGATIISPQDTRNPFSKADIALKKAENTKNIMMLFDEDGGARESAYNYVIRFTELINNRENESFKAVFQPIFKADGITVAWYEALMRVKKKNGEYASVFPYLEVARSTGFYQYLTDFIVKKSAEAIIELDVDISVNISINDIIRPDFIALVDAAYAKIKHKRGRFIFEILESDELVELDRCIWFIDYIAKYGFKIAIDDFGTGYSNYVNLINLPIDIVKIDGSLIKKIKTDQNARTLVEGIVLFCQKSNKKTVAEYVEDIHVFESLKNMNIDFLQGYYLSEPSALVAECEPIEETCF